MNSYINAKEQVEYLKKRNLGFKKISEKEARNILVSEPFFYRLVSYKHYFSSYRVDENGDDDFTGIDFSDLKQLSDMDGLLREELNKIALDIESYFKANIISNIENDSSIENPQYVYYDLLDIENRYHIVDKMKKRVSSFDDVYSKKMLKKYPRLKPIWVLNEYLSFGEIIELMYRYVKIYNYDFFETNEAYLHGVKIVRNITVHSNKLFVSRYNHYDDFHQLQEDYVVNLGLKFDNSYFNNYFKYNLMSCFYLLKLLAPDYVYRKRMNNMYLQMHGFMKENAIFRDFKHENVIVDWQHMYYVIDKMY